MKCWIDKTITFNDAWGPGADDLLRAPLGCNPEVALRARYMRNAQGGLVVAQLTAECASGFIGDPWYGAVFTPVGTVPVEGIHGLPPWDGTPETQKIYRDMINGPNNNLGKPGTIRLETVLPYVGSNGVVGYDTVRLFYAFNAVYGSEIADLVIAKTATLVAAPGQVGVLQEGGGSGPPR